MVRGGNGEREREGEERLGYPVASEGQRESELTKP